MIWGTPMTKPPHSQVLLDCLTEPEEDGDNLGTQS